MIGSNAKYQALLTDTERKLAQAQAAADEARDTVRRLAGRVEVVWASFAQRSMTPYTWACCGKHAAYRSHSGLHASPLSAATGATRGHARRGPGG